MFVNSKVGVVIFITERPPKINQLLFTLTTYMFYLLYITYPYRYYIITLTISLLLPTCSEIDCIWKRIALIRLPGNLLAKKSFL